MLLQWWGFHWKEFSEIWSSVPDAFLWVFPFWSVSFQSQHFMCTLCFLFFCFNKSLNNTSPLCILHFLSLNTVDVLLHRLLFWHSYLSSPLSEQYLSIHSTHSTLPFPTHSNLSPTLTVKLNIPGAGILQSPIVACLYRAYPANLSSFVTVFEGCHERTNSAVSSNFFYSITANATRFTCKSLIIRKEWRILVFRGDLVILGYASSSFFSTSSNWQETKWINRSYGIEHKQTLRTSSSFSPSASSSLSVPSFSVSLPLNDPSSPEDLMYSSSDRKLTPPLSFSFSQDPLPVLLVLFESHEVVSLSQYVQLE